MSAAQLNVEIGARVKNLQKGLRQAERELKAFERTAVDLGNRISIGLSLPFAAFGVAAIKAAGDVEALKKSMEATFTAGGRSIEAAHKELEALRKAAEAPGLDFEQAVKGSLRLQGVGIAAEEARRILAEFGNAVALGGGTPEGLDRVSVQLSQIIGKGKILNEDLKILKENMPGVSQAMVRAFGTADAEGLRELGISTEAFVKKLTDELAKLPRVEGGISNAIVNAGTSIKFFLGSVGDSLNKTFDITGKLQAFSSFLGQMAQGFATMDDGTRRLAAGIGVFALALGPAIRVGGALTSTFLSLQNVFTSLKIAALQSQVVGLAGAWKALDITMRASIIGATIGIVLALGAAFYTLNSNVSTATRAQETLAEVSKRASDDIAEQRVKTGLLVDVLKSNTASLDEKKAALARLNEIAPEYFKGLNAEKLNIDQLNLSYEKYIDSILRAARAKAAEAKLIELDKQALAIAEKKARLQSGGGTTIQAGFGVGPGVKAQQEKAITDQLVKAAEKEEAAIKAQMDALKGIIKENVNLNVVGQTTVKVTKSKTDANKELAKSYREIDQAAKLAKRSELTSEIKADRASGGVGSMAQKLGLGAIPQSLPGLGIPESVTSEKSFSVDGKLDKISALTQGLKDYVSVSEQLGRVNDDLQGGILRFGEAFGKVAEVVGATGKGFAKVNSIISASADITQQAAIATTAAMIESADKGETSFRSLGGAAIAAAAKVVRAYIMQGVAAAAAKALSSVPFPFNLAAGAAAGAAAGVLFNKALAAIKIPGFAEGTSNAPGGMAIVGERGPELVNLPRYSQVIPNTKIGNNMQGSRVEVGGTFRVSGTDLLLVLEKAQNNNKRIRAFG